MEGLYNFAKIGKNDHPENYQNLVMLNDTASVEVAVGQEVTDLDLTLEGFANNDASLLVVIETDGEVTPKEFLISRTGSKNSEECRRIFQRKELRLFYSRTVAEVDEDWLAPGH